MAPIQEQVTKRFVDLAKQAQQIPLQGSESGSGHAAPQQFYEWATSALNVIQGVFGKDSPHYVRLEAEMARITHNYVSGRQLDACRGIFLGLRTM